MGTSYVLLIYLVNKQSLELPPVGGDSQVPGTAFLLHLSRSSLFSEKCLITLRTNAGDLSFDLTALDIPGWPQTRYCS